MKAIIIGSGIAGLAAAIRLRIKGYQVQVFEAQSTIGGKAGEWHEQGFRFDLGPSLLTLPELMDEIFILADRNPADYFNYEQLDIICRYFWEDGTRFDTRRNASAMAQDAWEKFEVQPQILSKYLKSTAEKYELTCSTFLEHSLHKVSTWTQWKVLKALFKLSRLHLMESMHERNLKALKEPHLVQLFDRYATYNGSSPYQTSALFNLISYPELKQGAYFPKEGIRSIPESLHRLSVELGVEFHLNHCVEKMENQNGQVRGIQSNGRFYAANVVVSNMDVYPTYQKLLPEIPMPKYVRQGERSTSAVIFYWGMNRTTPELDAHNIFFSEDYVEEFQGLFQTGVLSDDPTIYVHVSSKINAKDAPEGKENWFVMVNAPSLERQSEDIQLESLKEIVAKKLHRILGFDPRPYIVCEKVRGPQDIEKETLSHLGSLYGTSSNELFSAFHRHPNFSRHLKGLYFCGGSVHPGGGVPLCLYSAKIATSLIPDA
ncbi:phytoene desaturase [bacterium SCSIO 12741]|nr:phytoene desaturase [bacterium SCSIO 12741]